MHRVLELVSLDLHDHIMTPDIELQLVISWDTLYIQKVTYCYSTSHEE
jgi:hypothetical protein